jgi:hypothetical protein
MGTAEELAQASETVLKQVISGQIQRPGRRTAPTHGTADHQYPHLAAP